MTKLKNDWRDWLADLLGLQPEDRSALMTMLRKLKRRGEFVSREEMKMIEGVLGMRDKKIRDVMIRINDAVCMNLTDDYAAAVRVVREWQHSRYPVTDGINDNVVGILLAKDLLGYTDRPDEFQMKTVMRDALFEPDSKPLDTLLQDFRKNRSHMGIVRDEFTQTVGIVTIEDLLERIVGEIEDESDEQEDLPAEFLPAGDIIVKGAISLEEFNELTGNSLPGNSGDTVAGWMAAQLGRMPHTGDRITAHGYQFTVTSSDGRRIHRVKLTPASDSETETSTATAPPSSTP